MTENKLKVLANPQVRENYLIRNVYGYMSAGLALTALVAFLTSQSSAMIRFLYSNAILTIVLFVVQIGLVIYLSSQLEKMSERAAIFTFFGYSAVTGLVLSSIFLVYAGTTIYSAFLVAALMFLGASVYGTLTKRNLASWGNYLFMGLWGLIIASVVSLFFPGINFVVSLVGVVLFAALTAYDTRRIVEMNREFGQEMTKEEYTKLGIIGALNLYLDFLNIFLYLLRLFGASNRD